MTDKNKPYFVTTKIFHGDNDYIEWLKEIKIGRRGIVRGGQMPLPNQRQ